MKKVIYLTATLLGLTGVFAFSLVQNWQMTDKYAIRFSSNDVGGIFKSVTGNIHFDEKDLATSRFDITIDASSINTGNGLQNKHAKSDEWFDVAKYPVIKYISKKIVKSGNAWLVTGDLDIHGVKKELTFPFNFQNNGGSAVFSGKFNINRSDFHIGKPGGDVAEIIQVEVSVPVVKK